MTHPLLAEAEHEQEHCREALLDHLKNKAVAVASSCKVTNKLVMWLALQGDTHTYSFQEIVKFIRKHPHWPSQAALQQAAERVITDKTPNQDVLDWFEGHTPLSGEGVLAYAAALKKAGKDKELKAFVKLAWVERNFSKGQAAAFLKEYASLISQDDHHKRLDRLLWTHHTEQAQDMMAFLSKEQQALAKARMAFKKGDKARVPSKFEKNEGALYDQVVSLRKQKRFDEAAKLILQAKQSAAYAKQWWKESHYIAREYIEMKKYAKAYSLVVSHKLKEGEDFANAEWTAGWLALRFLGKPKEAIKHFQKLHSAVRSPISVSRAAYWVGRGHEALKEVEKAAFWHEKAAAHPTTFYGQLAAAKLRKQPYPDLEHDPVAEERHTQALLEDELTQVLRILMNVGKPAYHLTRSFALNLAQKASSKEEKHALVHHISEVVPHETVWVAKKLGAREHLTLKHGYPYISDFPVHERSPEKPLLHALAYQESRFDPHAISSAGAMGLMQLMPGTAKVVAKQVGVPHKTHLLTDDPAHNLALGSHHMAQLLERFDHSYILAIASYNAGHEPVERWIKTFGDPRKGEVDIIDWIELIPYYETRNYVQRVLEAISPYRSLIHGEVTHTIIDDLQRGSEDQASLRR